jgi:hypothetical protein
MWDCGKVSGTVTAELRGGTLTIRGAGRMKDYSASAYNAPWYGSRSSITNVVIEHGVISIAAETFWGCTGLKSVTIPYSVHEIGTGAFLGCTGLTSINVAVENIYYSSVDGVLFYTRDGVYSLVQFPAGKRSASYAIPDGVTAIERGAFFGCTGLASVVIPNSVASINGAFVGCGSLTSIEVASGNVNFRSEDGVLFYTGDADEYILLTYPGNRRGAYAIPSGVTRLREKAFLDCLGLTAVTIPNSVMFIENYAFSGCAALTSVAIPGGVLSIEDWVFSGCAGLTSIDVAPDNAGFRSIDGVLFRVVYDKEELMAFPAGRQGAYTVPNGVTSIGCMTFFNCAGLTSVTIPDSVTYIGGWAFMECYGLTSVTVGAGVMSIGRGAFMHCHDLTSVISLSVVPPVIEENKYGIFDVFDIESAVCLYVPKNCVGIYKYTEGWKEFGSIKSADTYVPAASNDHAVSRDRPPEDAAEAALASALSGGGFSVGQNAVGKPAGAVSFFRHGSRIESAKLYIYDVSGEVVRKIKIGDHNGDADSPGASAKPGRSVGSWDLRDVKGRPVSGGTYLVKGELKMSGGKRERVSVVVDVR